MISLDDASRDEVCLHNGEYEAIPNALTPGEIRIICAQCSQLLETFSEVSQ